MSSAWSEWQVAQLDECVMRGIGPAEAAALIGKTKDEVCAKMQELGLLFPPDESPSTAPDEVEPFPHDAAASEPKEV